MGRNKLKPGPKKALEIFIGIDPGITGAMAAWVRDSDTWYCHDFDEKNLVKNINKYVKGKNKVFVTMELINATPNFSRVSTHKLGRNVGYYEGVLKACGIDDILFVLPKTWQKFMMKNAKSGGTTKDKSLEVARSLGSKVPLSQKKCHNRADAMLIALYGAILHGKGGHYAI